MMNNNQKLEEKNYSVNNLYNKNRKSIIDIIKSINTALYNSSQTFFLCLYYMDLIFNNSNFDKLFKLFYEDKEDDLKIEINKSDIIMISLSCLIVATKYNENDPNVPNIISFINLCSYYSFNKFNYKVNDITKAEVIVLKFLEYKLNYFTLYHYFSFFFTHGFLFENIFEKEIIKEQKYKKDELLEKIYILSREIMNKFVEDNNNINYILGNKIYFTSIQILIWSTEHILNISFIELFKEEKNIFTLLYKIDLEGNKDNNEKIKNIIKKINDDIHKKGKNNRNDNNFRNNVQFNTDNKENYVANPNSKGINNKNVNIHNHNHNHNNLLTSCDKYYLDKYKNNNYLDNKLKNEKLNIKNKYKFYFLKYKFMNKNTTIKSKSTNNYKYKQLFQNGNNFYKNKKYHYSSDKKNIAEENDKKEQNKEKQIQLKNLVDNLDKKFTKTNIKSNYNKDKDKNTLNQLDNNNLMTLNYHYDNNTYTNTLYNLQNFNDIDSKKDIVYKTKMILEKYNNPSSINYINNFISSNNSNNNNNNESNYYYNKLYENKKNYILNNRYNLKENIPNNHISNSMTINQLKNKNIDFIKTTKLINENTNYNYYNINSYMNNNGKYYKKEDNELNKNYTYGTFYQYGKLNQYENIDKFCNTYQKSNYNYIPYYFKSSNKCYY